MRTPPSHFFSYLIALYFGLFFNLASASVTVANLPISSLVPSGAAIIPTASRTLEGRSKDQRILLADYQGQQYAVIGIPFNAPPGAQQFHLNHSDGSTEELQFTVINKGYVEQRLTITHNRQVNPNFEGMVRINRERTEMNAAAYHRDYIKESGRCPKWSLYSLSGHYLRNLVV